MSGFEEWFAKKFPEHSFGTLYSKRVMETAWQAAQNAEKEKYSELIAAAEAVIKQWEPPLCPVIYRLLDVIERMKNEN